jgi:hypothetical protein
MSVSKAGGHDRRYLKMDLISKLARGMRAEHA